MDSAELEALADILAYAERRIRMLSDHRNHRPPADTQREVSFEATDQRIVLTVREAAELLGISRNSMYSLIRSGEVPSIAIGRLKRIPRTGLLEWISKQQA